MATFPLSIKPLVQGYNESVRNNVVTSQNEVGIQKTRRRATADVKTYSVSVMLTVDEKTTIDTFYQTTLEGGTLPFDWVDFWDDTTQEYIFKSPPNFTTAGGDVVMCSFNLERTI
jgi:hypothetical protein